MQKALIGHTGFVGSNLLAQGRYAATFNSSSIGQIQGRRFDLVVCAGVSAVKWWANQHPQEDWRGIAGLIDHLRTVVAAHFVLISTIDVYRDPVAVTEANRPDPEGLHPYGRNRLQLEDFVAENFARHSIVRLPGLFGPGLKKNIIFDMQHDNQLEVINPASCFQWYPLARIGRDIDAIVRAGAALVNLATEPIETGEIHRRYFAGKPIGGRPAPAAAYDMRTTQPGLLGGAGDYHLARGEVLAALAQFLSEKGRP